MCLRLGQNGGPARGPAAYSARPRRGPLHDCRGTAAPRAGRKDAGRGGGDRRGVSLGLSPRRAAGGTGRGSDGRAGDGLPCIGAGRDRAEAYGRQRSGGDCGFVICKGGQRQGPSEPLRPASRPALRARTPLSLRDISPRSGESPPMGSLSRVHARIKPPHQGRWPRAAQAGRFRRASRRLPFPLLPLLTNPGFPCTIIIILKCIKG